MPEGVIGELYIGGVGVDKGYYNMPEKTSEVFLTIDGIPYFAVETMHSKQLMVK